MLGPGNYGMRDIDSGVREKSQKDHQRQPPEEQDGTASIGLRRFGHRHCTSGPGGEGPSPGANFDLQCLITGVFCNQNRAGYEGRQEDDQNEDGIANVQILE